MGRIARALVLTGAAFVAVAPSASAGGEISDPCGPGTLSRSGIVPIYPEPSMPWLDICSAEVSGVAGAGQLRAVRSVIRLYGDVAAGAGAAYQASFKTEHCMVHQRYRIYPGPQGTQTDVEGNCGYRTEPCEWPESEAPNYSCGSYEGEFRLTDSPAVAIAVDGGSVTITFDPNEFPAASLPGALAHDLAPEGAPGEEVHYGSLTAAWVFSMHHDGVRGLFWGTTGLIGDSAPWAESVPLG